VKALPYVLLFLCVVAFVVWLTWGAHHKYGEIRAARRQRALDADHAAARWCSYRRMDADTGNWRVGIELRTPKGQLLHAPPCWDFPESASEDVLMNAHANATNRAELMNSYGSRPL
jgi:hypothetical protein